MTSQPNSSHAYNGATPSRAMRKLGKLNRGQPRAIDIKKLERILKKKKTPIQHVDGAGGSWE